MDDKAIVEAINTDKLLWDETITFAASCSWKPGAYLADRMCRNDFADWERVFTATDDGKVVGFCVFEEKGRVPPEYAFSPFINLVFVDEAYRGRRISEKMIRSALNYAKSLGFKEIYVKSEHHGLYEKYGFTKIADFEPVQGQGPADQLFKIMI